MPSLQLRCSVHPYHLVDTCQGAVNFLTGAEPLGALWALCGSEVEGAAMSATMIPLLTYDKPYPLGDLPERRERSYGSRSPPLYSLSCVNRRLLCTLDGAPPKRSRAFTPSACTLPAAAQTTHPPLGRLVEKIISGDGSTTLALLHFMRPIHFLPDCVSSATCSASARVRLHPVCGL